jgi:hypothetical protein
VPFASAVPRPENSDADGKDPVFGLDAQITIMIFFFYTYLSGLNIVLVQLNICYYCRTSDQNSLDRFTLTALSRIKSLKIASRFTFGKSKEIK